VSGKNGSSNNGTNGNVGKNGMLAILGFRAGLGVWKEGLSLGMGV